MEVIKAFENIQTIQIQSPVDKIIGQIRSLISTGQLKPGDRLPAERLLAEKFGVGRGYIREAILKLEFYGLLKTSPQSGTYVSGLSIKILDSIFADIINFNKDDFSSMIEARYYLEINSARLAARRRTDNDIALMKEALHEFDIKINRGNFAVQEDMLFHIRVASATKNPVIESMIVILIPDLIKIKRIVEQDIIRERTITLHQHYKIVDAIADKDEQAAAEAMTNHLSEMMHIRETLKSH
jgi:GntR family transcriptional regulator, transcriptional repressor for pyruvate dehydrogenase complex